MPSLIVHHRDVFMAGELTGPVLIGRMRACAVTIDASDVSRVHAWIGKESENLFFVADTFSRLGTQVNGVPITGRHTLRDGDEINIGPARVRFRQDVTIPEGSTPLDLSARLWTGPAPDILIRFACTCGAKISVGSFFADRIATCAYCHTRLLIPRSSGQVAGSTTTSEYTSQTCSICQCAIAPLDDVAKCPSCALSFHADCWTENKGCSAYGCDQVNILMPSAADEATEPDNLETQVEAPPDDQPLRRPWLPIAVGLTALGAVAAGTVGYLLFMR